MVAGIFSWNALSPLSSLEGKPVRGRENDQNLSEGMFAHPALGDFGQLFVCINAVGNLDVQQSMVLQLSDRALAFLCVCIGLVQV